MFHLLGFYQPYLNKDLMAIQATTEFIYQDLIGICKNKGSISAIRSYRTLRKLFLAVLDAQTQDAGYAFSGPYAKMDYLAKENHLPKNTFRSLNRLRDKLRALHTLPEKELSRSLPYDVKLFAEFVSNVSHTSVPEDLVAILPKDHWTRIGKKERIISDCMRIVVQQWDDDFIFATSDSEDEPIKIRYNFETKAGSLTPIGELLYVGSQLNLIRPKYQDGIYYPEMIILDPDFLVDISTIAETFEEYGLTPLSYLVKRLSPRMNSQAILIGNLAGQFLDEEVYDNHQTSYKESAVRFFQNNPIALITCPDFNSFDFHREAKNQQQNIRRYTEKQLDGFRIFDPEKVLLEPSFFCETLGLQGRMDLLTDDKRVLIEQKSGKWNFPNGGHQEKHYVQMLFFLAWLRYNLKLSTEDISCLLLYSKYPTIGKDIHEENGLIKEGPAPKLLFTAIQLRNSIVALEKRLSEGAITLLDKIDAETLNVNNTQSKLWKNFQKPSIEKVLAAVQQAYDLEKEYFFRLYTFEDKEYHLAKTEFASAWNLTMDEKIEQGIAYADLQIVGLSSTEDSKAGVDHITMKVGEKDLDNLPNFRTGDVVVCYAYDKEEEPNMCKDIVLRATLSDMQDDTLTLKLRSPQRNKHIFEQKKHIRWAIEHDFLDSSYSSVFKSLFSFLLMRNKHRKDLILNKRKPETDETVHLLGDYGTFNELVLRTKQAKDYFLVIGPPGTGKTSFALVNILKETLLTPSSSVMLASYTNRAVEEICSKLIKESIDFIRIGHEHACTPTFDKSYLLKNKIKKYGKADEICDYLQSVRVYVGTTAAIAATSNIFELKQFDLAIIDEASQILEPQLIGLLTAGDGTAIRKFVFIGDQKQLPAVVLQSAKDSKVESEALQAIGMTDCRNSFFERLLNLSNHEKTIVYQLNKQGRMHSDVSSFINPTYYASMLENVPTPHQKQQSFYAVNPLDDPLSSLLRAHRMLCFHVESRSDETSDNINTEEAKLIAKIAKTTYDLFVINNKVFDPSHSLGVIVPYRSQIAMVRKSLENIGNDDLRKISIDTVERYQGSERDVIIYGTTVKKSYQLDFLCANIFEEDGRVIDRKLNVSITRAREQMILVGNTHLLMQSSSYRPLIRQLRDGDALFDIF